MIEKEVNGQSASKLIHRRLVRYNKYWYKREYEESYHHWNEVPFFANFLSTTCGFSDGLTVTFDLVLMQEICLCAERNSSCEIDLQRHGLLGSWEA